MIYYSIFVKIIKVYKVATKVLSIFLISLFFLFGRGLLIVSAGAKTIITVVQNIEIISFVIRLMFMLKTNSGKHINSNIENIKQSWLCLAWNPNAKNLNKLKAIVIINTSFIMWNKNPKNIIIIVLVIVKYIPSNPYFISTFVPKLTEEDGYSRTL